MAAAVIHHPSSTTTTTATLNSFLSPPSFRQNPSLRPSLSLPNPHHHKHHLRRIRFSATQSLLSPPPQPPSSIHLSPPFPPPLQTPISSIDLCLTLLRSSTRHNDAALVKAVHATILKLQEEEEEERDNTYLGNALLVAYLKLRLVSHAYSVFKSLSYPDVVSYTAMVSGFAKAGRGMEAVGLFNTMRGLGIEANEYSYVAILSVCMNLVEFGIEYGFGFDLGLQVQGLVVKLGFLENVFVCNALLGFYSKCGGCLDCVFKMFDEMPRRDVASWNTVISSVVKEGMWERAFELLGNMQQSDDLRVDGLTLSTLLSACTGSLDSRRGREIHGHAIRTGLDVNLSVCNALISFYTKCGCIRDAEALFERMTMRDVITWTEIMTAYMEFGFVDMAMDVFNEMPEKNCVSYNALLAGLCINDEAPKVLQVFARMINEGMPLTGTTFPSVIKACGLLSDRRISEQIHGFVIKHNVEANAQIEAGLLDMCTRCGRMAEARKMFSRWSHEFDSSIICTSMICGYAQEGKPDEAISFFQRCQLKGMIVLDDVASTSVLGVCGTLGFSEMGKQIHCHVLKSGVSADVGVSNALISMYSKCWNLDDAVKLFNDMQIRDVVTWNGLIAGHLLYKQGDVAMSVWKKLNKAGVEPDKITLILVISAYRYTKSCLIDECEKLFHSMKIQYGLEPSMEHYASFVGVLGFWGFLDLAVKTVGNMPIQPDSSVWRVLLNGCRLHSDTSLGKLVVKNLLSTGPQDPAAYILVSNLYAASGRWHCAETIRKEMRERGLRKYPSRSWVIHQNNVVSFYTRDRSHSQTKDIYSGLDILILECLKEGYAPDTSFVLHEVEEYQKKDFLFYHSAKLAAAFGLLMTKPGKPVKIIKNIALCGDCHEFLKYVSAVARREIFLRDSSGFHHFSSGRCSCSNNW